MEAETPQVSKEGRVYSDSEMNTTFTIFDMLHAYAHGRKEGETGVESNFAPFIKEFIKMAKEYDNEA